MEWISFFCARIWWGGVNTLLSVTNKVGPFNGKFHALKVHILNGNLCIALAGNYQLGLTLINKVSIYIEKNRDSINNFLPAFIFSLYEQACYEQNRPLDDCEFLVMLSISSGNTLTKITAQGCKSFEKAYIGNSDAYKQLQSLRKSFNPPKYECVQQVDGSVKFMPFIMSDLEKNFIQISVAMQRLSNMTKDGDVAILGDNDIRIRVTKSGNFEYMQQGGRGISFTEGNTGISLLSSVNPRYGIGIFYQGGNFGDIFISGDVEYKRIRASTLNDFIKIAFQNHGLTLEGITW